MHATVLEESRSPWNNARLEELSSACEQVLTEGVHKIAALLNDLDNVSTAAEWSTRFGQRLFETARTFECTLAVQLELNAVRVFSAERAEEEESARREPPSDRIKKAQVRQRVYREVRSAVCLNAE